MTTRFSDALRSFLAANGSLLDALNGGFIRVYSGSQPSSASTTVPSGSSALLDFTLTGGTFSAGVANTVSLTPPTSGNVTGVVVNGTLHSFNSSLTMTGTASTDAAAIANAINRSKYADLIAVASSGVVVVSESRRALGAYGGLTVALFDGGNAVNAGTFSTGGQASVNGLTWALDGTVGAVSKNSSETWQGIASSAGSAAWYRIFGPLGAADTMFVDGSIGTSGTDMIMLPSVSIASGSTNTLPTATITM